jgi:hypothetical protein
MSVHIKGREIAMRNFVTVNVPGNDYLDAVHANLTAGVIDLMTAPPSLSADFSLLNGGTKLSGRSYAAVSGLVCTAVHQDATHEGTVFMTGWANFPMDAGAPATVVGALFQSGIPTGFLYVPFDRPITLPGGACQVSVLFKQRLANSSPVIIDETIAGIAA